MFANLPSPLTTKQEVRWLRRAHYLQLAVVILVLILAIVRLGLRLNHVGINPSNPRAGGGASGWGTGVAVKSIIFVSYQILTDRSQRFARWASLKANMVLNLIEAPFWMALVVITGGLMSSCVAPMCAINGIILVLSLLSFLMAVPVAYISVKHYAEFKRTGNAPSEVVEMVEDEEAKTASYERARIEAVEQRYRPHEYRA
ncbi:hypothetical protein I316_05926 [Kwoniella heveanensis BCC8398]|uniref:Uncharacterized protein n=1 Tax=Kwoniella heveanensis BCC8398 TaxID=1296120 RepID=A0A1B9GNA2_9TREE|nr:hypothetical protein I316_05926 [Kwoniella heveanensis BCC8398]